MAVLPFVKPRLPEPELTSVELRLNRETYSIQMVCRDADGSEIVGLEYEPVASRPLDFDMRRLAEAWDRWRDNSSIVA